MTVNVITGDCLEVLRTLPDASVHCVVTSPPYWGLRDYGHAGQLGLEPTPDEYVAGMVRVFAEVRRVLRDDGTLWANFGDSYNAAGRDGHGTRYGFKQGTNRASAAGEDHARPSDASLKPKDLCGIPWRVAFALQADGWYLRSDIIWSKPNPMPESVTDRPTKAHEYIFLLTKSARYYYDAAAIAEPVSQSMLDQIKQGYDGAATKDYIGAGVQDPSAVKSRILKRASWKGSDFDNGKTGEMMAKRGGKLPHDSTAARKARSRDDHKSMPTSERNGIRLSKSGNKERVYAADYGRPDDHLARGIPWEGIARNKRTVWTVTTKPYSGAHFATFPPDLIEPCIKAGCPVGGTVLDPFFGAGTTGLVADRLQRNCIGIELNPAYALMARQRIAGDAPLFAEVTAA